MGHWNITGHVKEQGVHVNLGLTGQKDWEQELRREVLSLGEKPRKKTGT